MFQYPLQEGSSLTCFQCSAPLGYKYACENKVNNKTTPTQQCVPPYTKCMTLVANRTIVRACGQSNVCSIYHNATRCSTCNYNLCNNGFVPSYYGSLGIFAALFSALKFVT
ncbi:hypothetical protein NQ318_022431 [Aromia moschata]|uniref:Uncharacterized protein n=1 Tax=Aromia moschata TaxID=1265417 RepID=A0AAV8Z541_9CUCU|nr:hypothetical protein NQ318_022431 [Aromia moschata]